MNLINPTQPILVVDDSDDDFEATKRALKKDGNLVNPIMRCEDGQELLDYLYRKGKYKDPKDSPRPGIILLDLNMPGDDGRVVLEEVKSKPDLKEIPIVILTTSDDERDIEGCYKNGANTYIKKPVDLESFFASIKRLKEYWFEIALLPRGNENNETK